MLSDEEVNKNNFKKIENEIKEGKHWEVEMFQFSDYWHSDAISTNSIINVLESLENIWYFKVD